MRRTSRQKCLYDANGCAIVESPLPWDRNGRRRPTRGMRDNVVVVAEDPYALKRTEELIAACLRAESRSARDPNRDPATTVF